MSQQAANIFYGGEHMNTADNIYKISLALQDKDSRTGLDLKDLLEDLAGAKEEYNALNKEGHRMLLLEPTRKRIYLLFKPGQKETFQQTMLEFFEDILKEGFDWQEYCSQDGTLLETKIIRPVETAEYERLLEHLQKDREHVNLGDPELEKLLKKNKRHNTGSRSRRLLHREEEAEPETDLEETLEQIDNLIGLDGFKKEIRQVTSYIKQLRKEGVVIPAREVFPYHYICTTEGTGVGLSTVLKLMNAAFYHMEISSIYGTIEEKIGGAFPSRRPIFMGHDFEENGLCAVIGVNQLDEEEQQDLYKDIIEKYQEQVIIMVMDSTDTQSLEKVQQNLKQAGILFRKMHLPAYSEPQLLEIFRHLVAPYNFQLSEKDEIILIKAIKSMQKAGTFHGTNTLKEIAAKMMLKVKSSSGEKTARDTSGTGSDPIEDYLQSQVVKEIPLKCNTQTANPLDTLNNLIGLQNIKERVREILGHFVVKKKKADLGVDSSGLCMHMIFTGNPGTGKTTVARIIGQVLKEEGLLEKGELIEVCREDLVARYVGHTALKTAAVVEKSLGSVLFIDEAYSLNGNHVHDFGHEVLATLVKKMEEHKDELVVIMAGYSDEMENMVALNPGLNSRVPHQIHFTDYSAEELCWIFEQQLGKEYRIEEAAVKRIKEIFAQASSSSDRRSGNGRFVRNLIERLKMKQSIRLYNSTAVERDEMLKIVEADVESLFEDNDIVKNLEEKQNNRIGF